MTADNGKMQQETITTALAVTTAMLSADDTLLRNTIREVSSELLNDDSDHHARLFVYVHQAAYLTELALDLAAMSSKKSIGEIHQALAAAVATTDWGDDAIQPD